MRPRIATSPAAITLPREAKEWAVRRRPNLPVRYSAYPTTMMKADPDGAGEPGSTEGPVRSTTQPERKGVLRSARRR